MLYSAIDDKAVARMCIKSLIAYLDPDRPTHNIYKLMVRMAVTRSHPVRVEEVAHQHQMIRIGEHLAAHARFGSKRLGVLIFYQSHAFSLAELSEKKELAL